MHSQDSMMSMETNLPPLDKPLLPYKLKFVLYSKNLLPQLEPILLFITEKAIIPWKHYILRKDAQRDDPDSCNSQENSQKSQISNDQQDLPQDNLHLLIKKPEGSKHQSKPKPKDNQQPKDIELFSKYPIYKLLKAISRIFLLNQIELIFFAQVLTLTEWNFNQEVIYRTSPLMYPFIAYDPTIKEDNGYTLKMKLKLKRANQKRQKQFKKLCLYIMCAAYSAKFYFVQKTQMQQYIKEGGKYIKDFEFIFKRWLGSYKNMKEILSPKVFNQTYMKVVQMNEKDEMNHNLVIDLILQLSPAYTSKNIPD